MSKNLIIDNGSYKIKIGYHNKADEIPDTIPNCIARCKDKSILIGDQIEACRDITGMYFKRPFEKGNLTSWETEKTIWDYSLNSPEIGLYADPHDSHLILTETPYHLPQLSINTDQIVFEEYGFESYYRTSAASLVPWNPNNETYLSSYNPPGTSTNTNIHTSNKIDDFELIIDSGFNCTWVIPVIYGIVHWPAVRKLSIGGRFLNGLLRELISFRYYDVTEETVLVNNIKEQVSYVTDDFTASLDKVHNLKKFPKKHISGSSDMICEYVLPDFKTTTTGYLLTKEIKNSMGKNYTDLQTIKLYDERFSVPETLFHPEIAGVNKTGLIETIIDSINSCPELVKPLLASNIMLVGGNFNIRGLKERLRNDLRKELPIEWDVRIGCSDKPDFYSWQSAGYLVESGMLGQVSISKKEYFEHGANWCQKRFGYKT